MLDIPLFPALVLIGLALLWGWVLVRPAAQNLLNGARRDPVGHFNRHLSVLGQTPQRAQGSTHGALRSMGRPGGFGAPARPAMGLANWSRQPMHKRRLQIYLALLIAAGISLLLAIVFRGVFIWQHLLIDGLLIGYTVLAARAGANENMRRQKVTYLDTSSGGSTALGPSRPVGYARAAGDR